MPPQEGLNLGKNARCVTQAQAPFPSRPYVGAAEPLHLWKENEDFLRMAANFISAAVTFEI